MNFHVHPWLLHVNVQQKPPQYCKVIQFSSVAQSCPTLCNPMNLSTDASLSITNSRSSLKLMCIELVMPSSHLILCSPLLLLPPIPPNIRVFSNESTLHMRWPKYWSFSLSISPSNEHPGPVSFRMDWLDLLAVQGTLKSLLQHHSSKALILRCSAFFTVQLSHPYMTTGKTITLTRRTIVGKVMYLLFNMLSRSDTTERLHFHFSLSCIGEGNDNPLQCSCLENPRDGGAWVSCHLWRRTESDTTEVT